VKGPAAADPLACIGEVETTLVKNGIDRTSIRVEARSEPEESGPAQQASGTQEWKKTFDSHEVGTVVDSVVISGMPESSVSINGVNYERNLTLNQVVVSLEKFVRINNLRGKPTQPATLLDSFGTINESGYHNFAQASGFG
jgi:hypothetical protein